VRSAPAEDAVTSWPLSVTCVRPSVEPQTKARATRRTQQSPFRASQVVVSRTERVAEKRLST
jgi:hypothetical protein